jgi:hypothetical protein
MSVVSFSCCSMLDIIIAHVPLSIEAHGLVALVTQVMLFSKFPLAASGPHIIIIIMLPIKP